MGHLFQNGDLPLYVTDLAGAALSPYKVSYTMYYTPKGQGCLKQAGPSGRTPVEGDVGYYYATGYAGQCGQPGDWLVKWKVQETVDSPEVEIPYHFKVFDTSQYSVGTVPSPCGCKKAGW